MGSRALTMGPNCHIVGRVITNDQWNCLWGVGRYWGNWPLPIGETASTQLSLTTALLTAFGGALVGAVVAQLLAHYLTTQREARADAQASRRKARDEYLAAYDAVVLAFGGASAAM